MAELEKDVLNELQNSSVLLKSDDNNNKINSKQQNKIVNNQQYSNHIPTSQSEIFYLQL